MYDSKQKAMFADRMDRDMGVRGVARKANAAAPAPRMSRDDSNARKALERGRKTRPAMRGGYR